MLPIVFIQNQLTKVPIPIPIPNINPLQPPLGAAAAADRRSSQLLKDTAKLTPIAGARRAASPRRAQSQDAVTATGTLDVLRYGRLLKARRLVGVRGAGHGVRRALLRQERDQHAQARRVQAELHADAQRPDLDHAEGAGMSDGHSKYYGKYRGMVVNNIDPMQMGRLQVQVPDVAGLIAGDLGDAVRAGRRHPERACSRCR